MQPVGQAVHEVAVAIENWLVEHGAQTLVFPAENCWAKQATHALLSLLYPYPGIQVWQLVKLTQLAQPVGQTVQEAERD